MTVQGRNEIMCHIVRSERLHFNFSFNKKRLGELYMSSETIQGCVLISDLLRSSQEESQDQGGETLCVRSRDIHFFFPLDLSVSPHFWSFMTRLRSTTTASFFYSFVR
jgi:hypothetical protein